MKLQNFFQLAFFALVIFLFASCKKTEDTPDNTPCTGIYTESSDAATGKTAMRVAATAQGVTCEGTSYKWTKDKVWILDGFVFVNEGQTLTIEAGTLIKGASWSW